MLAVIAAGPVSGASLLRDSFRSYAAGEVWAEGSTHGPWYVQFDGFGAVSVVSDRGNVLDLTPAVSTSPPETHAALVTSTAAIGDALLILKTKTVSQLRTPTPNPWEVAWVAIRYVDSTHFSITSPFLATGTAPILTIGNWNTVKVKMVGATLEVRVNNTLLTTFTDLETPYLSGSVGLYTEDADVRFDSVRVRG